MVDSPLHRSRAQEASKVLFNLTYTPGARQPLWIVSPMGSGKSTLLRNDLSRAATQGFGDTSYTPIYCSLRLDPTDPVGVIWSAINEALVNHSKTPLQRFKQVLNTSVEEIAVDGVGGVKFGTRKAAGLPERRNPSEMVALKEAITHTRKSIGKPVLLMLDDAQCLFQSEDYEALTSCLRSLVDADPANFSLVMAADNSATFNAMTKQRGAPMFDFGRLHPYNCDHAHFCEHVRQVTVSNLTKAGVKSELIASIPPIEDFERAFERLGYSYPYLWKYSNAICADPAGEHEKILFEVMKEERERRDASQFYSDHSALQQLVLQRLAQGQTVCCAQAEAFYSRAMNAPVQSADIRDALDALMDERTVAGSHPYYALTDNYLQAWLAERSGKLGPNCPAPLLPPDPCYPLLRNRITVPESFIVPICGRLPAGTLPAIEAPKLAGLK